MIAKTGKNRAAEHLNGGSKKTKKEDSDERSSETDDADEADEADEVDDTDERPKKTGRKKISSSSNGKPAPRKRRADFQICVERRVKLKGRKGVKIVFIPIEGAPSNIANTSEAVRWIKDNGESFASLNVVVIQIRERAYVEAVTKVTVRTGVSGD